MLSWTLPTFNGFETISNTIRKHVRVMYTPLNPTYIYIAKLGYAGVYLFFLFLLKNIGCGYSLEPPVLTCTHNLCFEQKKKNIKIFLLKIFIFTTLKIAWACFF